MQSFIKKDTNEASKYEKAPTEDINNETSRVIGEMSQTADQAKVVSLESDIAKL